MRTLFLSFSFRDSDRELVQNVEQLLASHNIQVVTGRNLGGGPLTQEVMARIEKADGLVALATRRDPLAQPPGAWTTHQWVRDELNHTHGKNMPAIALVEQGVALDGAYAEQEYIPLDRDQPLDAFLRLSDTIALWKREAGQRLEVRIMPEELSKHPGHMTGTIVCRYRYLVGDEFTDWKETSSLPKAGGAVVYLNGLRENYLVQLQLQDGAKQWFSEVTPPLAEIELKQVGGGS